MKFEIRMRKGEKIIELTGPVKFRDKSLAVVGGFFKDCLGHRP